ncbi:MscL family protein [Siccirubricoccus sp. G192]|uniref:MscL family protein n=1 Tax=Siccirubricoccus sp. G192 TaxID=2849651 RepID=UPI0028122A81|nr:MscL family protein [Siccirubricoccus sp. G192]
MLAIGKFLNTIIKFVIVSFAIFWVVKALSRLRLNEIGKAPPGRRRQARTSAEIRDELRAQRPGPAQAELRTPGSAAPP